MFLRMELKKTLNVILGLCGVMLIIMGLIETFTGNDSFESFVIGLLFMILSQLNTLVNEK